MIRDAVTKRPAVLVVFDLLALNAEDVRSLLRERRRLLHECIQPAPGIQLIEYLAVHGDVLFQAASHGYERVVAKRMDAPYCAGRQPAWLPPITGRRLLDASAPIRAACA